MTRGPDPSGCRCPAAVLLSAVVSLAADMSLMIWLCQCTSVCRLFDQMLEQQLVAFVEVPDRGGPLVFQPGDPALPRGDPVFDRGAQVLGRKGGRHREREVERVGGEGGRRAGNDLAAP